MHEEATRRGYRFDASKIAAPAGCADLIAASEGQLDYEWTHLSEKLRLRAPTWLAGLRHVSRPDPHPLFYLVPGAVAEWEVTQPEKRPRERARRIASERSLEAIARSGAPDHEQSRVSRSSS